MSRFGKVVILSGVCVFGTRLALAQAPPGPLTPPPTQATSAQPAPAPPRKPEVPPRKDIMGAWRFNKDESDDPREKLRQSSDSGNRGGGGYGGPRVGWPGGGGPMGGGGYGGHRSSSQDDESSRLGDLVNPARELQLIRRSPNDPEVEMIDDRERRRIFYTDGRKIEKQKDPGMQEIAAHWEENKLVTDEPGPHKGKISRTLEVSSDGKQLLETVRATDSKGSHPLTVQYVYDAVDPSTLSFQAH